MRIANRDLMKSFRDRVCEWCRKSSYLAFGHHLFSRGAGQVDIPGNLIGLCMYCHSRCHNGNEPTFGQLVDLVAGREHCTPLDIEEAVYYLRRCPKGGSAGQVEADIDLLTPGAQRLVRAVPEIARILAGGER